MRVFFHLYAEMDSTDPRVVAVKDWLNKNYTIEENPGMGPQGLFYYYHTMAKALTLSGITYIKNEKGEEQDWRKELSLHLLNLQSRDGSWINDNGRWWEKDPVLVTSHALLTLEPILHALICDFSFSSNFCFLVFGLRRNHMQS